MIDSQVRIHRFVFVCLFFAIANFGLHPVHAQTESSAQTSNSESESLAVSPTERIFRDRRKPRTNRSASRPMDGYGNNRRHPDMNTTDTPLRRYLQSDYADVYNAMSGTGRPNPRVISNHVFAQTTDRANRVRATDFVWQWGQFLDHDIDLTDGIDPAESVPIAVPLFDPEFDPDGTGNKAMAFNRSIYDHNDDGIRQQVNEITGWIDASNVYGSDDDRSAALRTLDGTGRLKTGDGNLLPNNVDGLENAGGSSARLFVAGDVRVNEQVALTAMHTLFMREHNRWVELLRQKDPSASGDQLYARARNLVAAEIQHITYSEFLPVLLGRHAMPRYRGYRARTDARIMNVFSAAAFRLGHSMLSPVLLRMDQNLQPIPEGHLALRDGFFAPDQIRDFGIEPLLRGLSQQLCQDVDNLVIDDVRNFLFGAPGKGGFDLVSLNIQRGRDHGLPSYNEARGYLGLTPAADFQDISRDPEVVTRMQAAYANVNDVDLWVGGLAEDKYRDSMLGELFHTLVAQQFIVLRDGDRHWYSKGLSRSDLKRIRRLKLADIIRLNTNIDSEIQDNVFRLPRSKPHRTQRRM